MLFKWKLKNKKNQSNNGLADNHQSDNNQKEQTENYDYEAVEFNDFLSDNKQQLKQTSLDQGIEHVNESPIEKPKANTFLDEYMPGDKPKTKAMPNTSENAKSFSDLQFNQKYTNTEELISSTKTSEFLKNQNTKVLLLEDIDEIFDDFQDDAKQATSKLSSSSNITKNLASHGKPKTQSLSQPTKNLNQSVNDKNYVNEHNSNYKQQNNNDEAQANNLSSKTKMLFNEQEIFDGVNENNLMNLTPVTKELEELRLGKNNKRDI